MMNFSTADGRPSPIAASTGVASSMGVAFATGVTSATGVGGSPTGFSPVGSVASTKSKAKLYFQIA